MQVDIAEKRWIWGAVTALLVVSIASSWIPSLVLPLGDDHQGRILGRMVLHADNILEKGWSGSNLGAAWEPYSNIPYAHHPPLGNLLHLGVAWAQGGATALGARLILVLGGIVSIITGAALVRKLTGHWLAVAAALAGLAMSGYFWLFGRSLTLVFPLIYLLLRAYAPDRPERLWVAGLWLTGMLGALQSWPAALIIGLVALYDLAKGRRVHALAAGVGVAVGLGLDFLWIESAAGISALRSHLEARAAAADYGLVDWIVRQGGFYLRFESVPVFLLTVLALVAGLRDPRFRPIVAAVFASVVVFAVVFDQNAWVHEYWNWQISWVQPPPGWPTEESPPWVAPPWSSCS
jgi:hypothetical protein